MINIQSLKNRFVEKHGCVPRVFRAPGRINLIGEHTDYNEGFVLPAAIDRATYVAASPRDDRMVVAESMDFDGVVSIDLDDREERPRSDWGKYVQGVALILESAGYRLSGADLLIASNIPHGAGLSSSAALEVAVGMALSSIAGHNVDGMELAKIGQAAEHKYAGVQSGLMDQFASVHGQKDHALFLDCRSLEWSAVPLGDAAFVICDTKTKHDLVTSEYNKRRSECEEAAELFGKPSLRDVSISDLETSPANAPALLKKRARHVVTENARVLAAVSALKAGDLYECGRLIDASHESLRDDFEVSCSELDMMVTIARRQPGILGARMMGGGFGGCTVNLIQADKREEFISNVDKEYQDATGIKAAFYDVKPTDGAREID